MSTIPITAGISVDAMVGVLGQLSEPELKRLSEEVLRARASRHAPSLSKEESELFVQINRSLTTEEWDRFDLLTVKRRNQALTPSEQQELIKLCEQQELIAADRLSALVELAKRRGATLDQLMDQLDIRPRTHA